MATEDSITILRPKAAEEHITVKFQFNDIFVPLTKYCYVKNYLYIETTFNACNKSKTTRGLFRM